MSVEFHKYALRIPSSLYQLIEEMAWENRTSVNIQLIDLLAYGVHTAVAQDPENVTMFEDGYDKQIQEIFKKQEATVKELFTGEKRLQTTGQWGTVAVNYPAWRNKK